MKNKMLGLMGLMAIMMGCNTGGGGVKPPTEIANINGDTNRVAVCIGWTSVNSFYYQGWAGDCPGCDVDAQGMYDLFSKNGFTTKLLMNGSAPWNTVRSTIVNSGKTLKAGGLLVITFSGHGGQEKDDNRDEADGMDETLCTWDGAVRDDEILKMLQELPIGVRVVMINDQCHSQGNFKAIWGKTKTFFGAKKKPVKALVHVPNMQVMKSLKATAVWNGPLIQFAGCREPSYSYGSTSGGSWSQMLLLVQDTSTDSKLTWRTWFDQGYKLMNTDQQDPQWVEYGIVADSFRNGTVLK